MPFGEVVVGFSDAELSSVVHGQSQQQREAKKEGESQDSLLGNDSVGLALSMHFGSFLHPHLPWKGPMRCSVSPPPPPGPNPVSLFLTGTQIFSVTHSLSHSCFPSHSVVSHSCSSLLCLVLFLILS